MDSSSADAAAATAVDESGPSASPLAVTANPLVDSPLAQFRLEVENMSDVPITSINVGTDFQLAAFVEDVRSPTAQFPGVWAAFMNVGYDAGLVSITATPNVPNPNDPGNNADLGIKFGDYFKTGLRFGNLGTAGQISGIGSASLASVQSGTGEKLLWRITVHATAGGTVVFTPSFDSDPDHESSFIDPPDAFTPAQIDLVPASLTIAGPPNVSIAPTVSHNEGNTGTSPATNYVFDVTLSAASTVQVTVPYATSAGTAQAADFVAQSGTLTFAPGQTTKSITIAVVGDTDIEGDETFNVTLSNPSAAVLGTSTVGVGTIVNDDTPTIDVTAVSQFEGAADNPLVFAVTTSQASSSPVLVPFQTEDGSAAAGDYTGTSGTLTFAAGSTTAQFVTVTVNGDTDFEQNENFRLVLTKPANAIFGSSEGEAEATLINDDGPHITFAEQTVSHPEGNLNTTAYVFTVNINVVSASDVTVEFETQNGTDPNHSASSSSDYSATTGLLSFAPGELTKDVTVLVKGDTLSEANEDFFLNLINPSANVTLAQTRATGTIVDEDVKPTLSFDESPVSVTEGDLGTSALVFTVNLSAASGQTITAKYSTNDGTATVAGNDYVPATAATLTFTAAQTQQTITVLINGDTIGEANENFTLDLFDATNTANAGSLATKITATGTILNNDPLATLAIGNVSHDESNSGDVSYVFTATLSAPIGETVTIPYTTADDTATAVGNDYTPSSGTLTFLAGQTSKTFTVLAKGDTLNEPDETFKINLTPSASVNLPVAPVTGTIVNNDPLVEVGINATSSTNELNGGTTDFVFEVTLNKASGQTVTVDFTTGNGTASVTDNDYVGQSGRLTFTPGVTLQFITVAVNGDTRNEADETFTVFLTNPQLATLASGKTSGQGIILNDDAKPTISVSDVIHSEGDSENTPFVFAVTLSAISGQTVTAAYATANGTATTGNNDYIATSGTVTFLPGSNVQNVTVQVKGDKFVEPDETFFLNLSNPNANATILDAQGTGTIQSEATDNVTFTVSTFSGLVFVDANGNSTNQSGEMKLDGIDVTLTGTSSITSNAVNKQTSSVNGAYSFADLEPGTYHVTFERPPGYLPPEALAGGTGATALPASDSAVGFNFVVPELGGIQSSSNNLAVGGLMPDRISMRLYIASAHASPATTAAPLAAPAVSALTSLAADSSSSASMRSALASTNSTAEAQITQNGSVVTVQGTSGDDHFEFTAGAVTTIKINGVTRQFSAGSVSSIVFNGGGGNDTATLTGSSGDDVADLALGSGTLTLGQLSVTVNDVSSLVVNGGGGDDSATLHDSALSDALQAGGNDLTLSNELNVVTSLVAFGRVQAISANGGRDTAHVESVDFALEQQGNWLAN